MGVNLLYDTLDRKFDPTTGINMDYTIAFFLDALGSDHEYEEHNFKYTQHWKAFNDDVFVIDGRLLFTEDAPRSSMGTLRNFRAYTSGEVVGEYTSWIQAEYRYAFHPHWKLAAFGGIGFVADDLDDFDEEFAQFPMGGLGARWLFQPKSGLVLRCDVALGKDDNEAFYLQVGQPF